MTKIRHVAVIDVGKTNAKVALVDLLSGSEIAVRKQPNQVLYIPPYPHYDTEAIWQFILRALTEINQKILIDAISVTTHGATAALVNEAGKLALPILDYEWDGYGDLAARYNEVRPSFSETGSPRLPMGLNLGAQLYWQQHSYPAEFSKVTSIIMYPQYWSFRLCGVRANEVTSLGCHTDLWCPSRADYSTLMEQMGWRKYMAPLRKAHDVLGTILPEIAQMTGVNPSTPIGVGIHDSNASLVPHLMGHTKPFCVVSTGTWVIAMSIGNQNIKLDETRDTLINVSAFGDQIPSARFMGGREFEILMQNNNENYSAEDLHTVLGGSAFLMPSVVEGCGPFPFQKTNWVGQTTGGELHVAVSFYLALMTATCLELVNGQGDLIIEGPFSKNTAYCAMLEAATGHVVLTSHSGMTGTTIGVAVLHLNNCPDAKQSKLQKIPNLPLWQSYAVRWKCLVAQRTVKT